MLGHEHRKAELPMEKASSEIEAAKDNESASVRLKASPNFQNDAQENLAKQEWVVVLVPNKEKSRKAEEKKLDQQEKTRNLQLRLEEQQSTAA